MRCKHLKTSELIERYIGLSRKLKRAFETLNKNGVNLNYKKSASEKPKWQKSSNFMFVLTRSVVINWKISKFIERPNDFVGKFKLGLKMWNKHSLSIIF